MQQSDRRAALEGIYIQIEDRASAVTNQTAWFPCRKGCDLCCRTLSQLPVLTLTEWEYLWEGFVQLPAHAQAAVRERVSKLSSEIEVGIERDAYICPLLDRTGGSCMVYRHRPVTCRAYGFYVEHGQGNWCEIIEGLIEEHGDAQIIWGNRAALDAHVDRLHSPSITLLDWFAAHPSTEKDRHESSV